MYWSLFSCYIFHCIVCICPAIFANNYYNSVLFKSSVEYFKQKWCSNYFKIILNTLTFGTQQMHPTVSSFTVNKFTQFIGTKNTFYVVTLRCAFSKENEIKLTLHQITKLEWLVHTFVRDHSCLRCEYCLLASCYMLFQVTLWLYQVRLWHVPGVTMNTPGDTMDCPR